MSEAAASRPQRLADAGAGLVTAGAVDPAFWRDRRVLVTGHNGFKGAWLCLWLQALGARVCGASLPAPPTSPSLYELAGVEEGMEVCFSCDVRDSHALAQAVHHARAEVVIHMAAQPLVRASFAAPAATFAVNGLGVAHLLDAVRECDGVRAVVVVTSDKCYAPNGSTRGHVEDDPLGGEDPYSASKACAELVVQAYRDSFFSGPDAARVASARAGNVIGGGDFGAERLLPDVFRAALAGDPARVPAVRESPDSERAGGPLPIRNPDAVRPWQHVLSPLSGYLLLAQTLWESPVTARAWNFGPSPEEALPVRELVERVAALWPGGVQWRVDGNEHPRENPALRLESTRARAELGWQPLVGLEEGLRLTVEWFRAYREGKDMRTITRGQLPRLCE